ncbi:hypothetical protein [Terasakiella pusilla]|uniref:hypothetical protein n=1 Tax=Terasakiella pusilla TaxID=64973 RepID=UPI003AA8DC54
MLRIATITVLALLVLSSNSHADNRMTVSQLLNGFASGNASSHAIMKSYISGARDGVLMTNLYLEEAAKLSMFCTPEEKLFSAQEIYAIGKRAVRRMNGHNEPMSMFPFLLTIQLTKEYPC